MRDGTQQIAPVDHHATLAVRAGDSANDTKLKNNLGTMHPMRVQCTQGTYSEFESRRTPEMEHVRRLKRSTASLRILRRMITKIDFPVWHCTECGTVWLPRRGNEQKPTRCPNRACRKRGRDDEHSEAATVGLAAPKPKGSADRGSKGGIRARASKAPVGDARERAADIARADCPDCGKQMTQNYLMRRWQCECGYQMKVKG